MSKHRRPTPRSARTRRLGYAVLTTAATSAALAGLAGNASALESTSDATSSVHTATHQLSHASNGLLDGAQSSSDARSSSATVSTGDRIVSEAADQAGKPYSYGEAGPDSFDCSGLTQYVHDKVGISLPRTADEQRSATDYVDQADKKPGDLIFFSDGGSVYHVGIYAGNGEIWHAPEPGDTVSKDPIWDDSYTVGRAW